MPALQRKRCQASPNRRTARRVPASRRGPPCPPTRYHHSAHAQARTHANARGHALQPSSIFLLRPPPHRHSILPACCPAPPAPTRCGPRAHTWMAARSSSIGTCSPVSMQCALSKLPCAATICAMRSGSGPYPAMLDARARGCLVSWQPRRRLQRVDVLSEAAEQHALVVQKLDKVVHRRWRVVIGPQLTCEQVECIGPFTKVVELKDRLRCGQVVLWQVVVKPVRQRGTAVNKQGAHSVCAWARR